MQPEPLPASASGALPQVDHDLIRAHGLAALATLGASALFGLAVSLKFVIPDFLGGTQSLTWGLLRFNHTQGILFGWLGNSFLAFTYHVVPRLTGRPVASRRLGWVLFLLWNLGLVLPGWILVQAHLNSPWLAPKSLEWTEFPLLINTVAELALLLSAIQFLGPFFRRDIVSGRYPLFISGWYLIGGLVFTLLAFPTGSIVPLLVPGAIGAAFSGLWIHDAVGLYVTPLALVIAYYVIPASTRRPIHSHFLSILGFWGLFFLYPLNGTHHYVYSALPMDTQRAAIAASFGLGADVVVVVFNLLMSLRGCAREVRRDVPLRFVWAGVVLYLVVSLQGSLQASMTMQAQVHFTDWVIGHSHLAMIGFASLIAIGGLGHAWQRLPSSRYHAGWMNLAFWLILGGLLGMVGVLTAAGLIEGRLWQTGRPWMDSVDAVKTLWWLRTFTGVPLIAGFVALFPALLAGRPALAPPRGTRGSRASSPPLAGFTT